MTISNRSYTGPEDLRAMESLLKLMQSQGLPTYFDVVDMREGLSAPGVLDNVRLWYSATGELVWVAWVDAYANLCNLRHPQADPRDFEDLMVDWCVDCIRRTNDSPDATLDATARADDAARLAFLARFGFEQQSLRSLHFVRDLTAPLPEVQTPPGYRIRPSLGESEAPAWLDLHCAAIAGSRMSLEERLEMIYGDDYDPALDLVAEAPDATLAGYCVCTIYADENLRLGRRDGYTDPIAVHPAHQRRGLARALVLTGLHLLRERGMDTARTGTSSENLAMQQVALAVGFRIESEQLWFAKPVGNG